MNTFSKINIDLQKSVLRRVIELSFDDCSYNKIIKQISLEFNVKLNKSNLYYWFNHDIKLIGGVNELNSKPSKELAYVIGVLFGDGSIYFHKKKSDYSVRVDAIDKDFVEHFSKCVSKILNKDKNYAVVSFKQKAMTSIMYSTKARSKKLYYFIKELKEDFEKVKPFAKAFPKEFIQGVADSEGCPAISARKRFDVGVCVASSTNVKLLAFISFLLISNFNIRSKINKSKKIGMSDSIINGRIITRQKDLFALNITDFKSTKRFTSLVGFNIFRKQIKLIDSVNIFENELVVNRLICWNKKYVRLGRNWVHQKSN